MAKDTQICDQHGEQVIVVRHQSGEIVHETMQCGCTVERIVKQLIEVGDVVLYEGSLYRVDDVAGEDDFLVTNVNGSKLVPFAELQRVGVDTLSGLQGLDEPVTVGSLVRHRALGISGKVVVLRNGVVQCEVADGNEVKLYKWNATEVVVVRPGYRMTTSGGSRYFPSASADSAERWRQKQKKRKQRTEDWDSRYNGSDWNSRNGSDYEPPKKKPDPHSISTADLIKDEVSELERQERRQELDPDVKRIRLPEPKEEKEELSPVGPVPKRQGSW